MNTSLQGDLTSHANVRIDGRFDGDIAIDGNMMVGETANIHAAIHAHNVTVAGSVHGNITGNKIHVARTGRIWGDLSANGLSTEEGAFIEGKIAMANHPAARADRGEQPALNAPDYHSQVTLSGEDSATGESVDVEIVEDTPPGH
jgi:cytoskeletal protein CcmA (bactofilin family)